MSIHPENSKKINHHGLKKEIPFCSLKNEHLQELMHRKIILFPKKKIITNAIKENKITDEELLQKANNKFFTPNKFNYALKDLLNRKYALLYASKHIIIILPPSRII